MHIYFQCKGSLDEPAKPHNQAGGDGPGLWPGRSPAAPLTVTLDEEGRTSMGSQNAEGRVSYLLTCVQTASDELLVRIKHRDDWLKLQLATQVVILALANGIQLLGAELATQGGTESAPQVLWISVLSMPVSLVFYLLYVVEDRLVKHLADYLGDTSGMEARLSSGPGDPIPNFDSSRHLNAFFKETLVYRVASQFTVFLLIPGGIVLAHHLTSAPITPLDRTLAVVDLILAVVITRILFVSARFRARSLPKDKPSNSAER